jgi:hypothetical protein
VHLIMKAVLHALIRPSCGLLQAHRPRAILSTAQHVRPTPCEARFPASPSAHLAFRSYASPFHSRQCYSVNSPALRSFTMYGTQISPPPACTMPFLRIA